MTNKIRLQAAIVLSEALEIPISADRNVYRKDLEPWDSLKHLELILLLEDRFRMRLSAEEAVNLNSLNDIVTLVEQKS